MVSKETLLRLGLTDWQIEKLLCVHGTEVAKVKEELKELKKDLEALKDAETKN